MAKLDDLPDETLHEIMRHLSNIHHGSLDAVAYVNKRLNSIVTPLFIHRWPLISRSDWANIGLFAHYLLHHPDEIKKIRDIQLPASGRFVLPKSHAGQQNLKKLALAATKLSPKLSAEKWGHEVLSGDPEAIGALVLSMATEIRSLDWTVYVGRPDESQAVGKLVTRIQKWVRSYPSGDHPKDGIPLLQLQKVRLANRDGDEEHMLAFPFFHLPNLQTFIGHNLVVRLEPGYISKGGDSRDQLPPGSSRVEEIVLESCKTYPIALNVILRMCRCLKAFLLKSTRHESAIGFRHLGRCLGIHAKSLRWLRLDNSTCDWAKVNPDGSLPLSVHLREFENLECIQVPLEAIFCLSSLPQLPRQETYRATSEAIQLPRSLQHLRLDARFGVWNRTIESNFRHFLEHIFNGCWPLGRNPKLKLIQIDDQNRRLSSLEVTRFRSLAVWRSVSLECPPTTSMPWDEGFKYFPRSDERYRSSPI